MLKSIVAESYHDSPVERKTGRSNSPMAKGYGGELYEVGGFVMILS